MRFRRQAPGNDQRLMDFNTWRVEHPVIDDHIVRAVNGHRRRTVTVSWAGSDDRQLSLLRDEASRRGITLIVRSARYTKAELHSAALAIFDAEAQLAAVEFRLGSVTTDPDPEGLVIEGSDLRRPDSPDDAPLAGELVRSVRDLVSSLDGVRGTFRGADIRIEPGGAGLLHQARP